MSKENYSGILDNPGGLLGILAEDDAERIEALLAHHGVIPGKKDSWRRLVVALIQAHEPQTPVPSPRPPEEWHKLAMDLARKHVPGFQLASGGLFGH